MTLEELDALVSWVTYKDWKFRVLEKGDGFLVQVVFREPDCVTGEMTEQHGRKWYVSSHACESEVVETCWAAVQRAVLHEARESFKYCEQPIMNPHFNAAKLATFAADESNYEAREPLPGRKS